MANGKLIVIEGSDSSGKKTQTELLVKRLRAEGRSIFTESFPRYGHPVVERIKKYMKENPTEDPYTASPYYAEDRVDASPAIEAALKSGEDGVLDRFTPSNAAHQGGKIVDIAKRKEFVEWLYRYEYLERRIPKPDLVVILRVPVEVSLRLINERGGARDGHEADTNHLRNAEATYGLLAEWYPDDHKIVECTENGELLSREAIAEKVYQLIKSLLKE